MPENENRQLASLAQVAAEVKALKERLRERAEDREKLERLTDEVSKISESIALSQAERKAEYSSADAEKLAWQADRAAPGMGIKAIHELPTRDPQVKEVQRTLDNLYILSTLLNKNPVETDYFKQEVSRLPLLRKALATSDPSAPNWIPQNFSADMHEKVRLSLRVAALHDRIAMPTSTFKVPVEGADASAYLVSEATGPDDELDASKRVPSTLNSPSFANLTLTAKKIGARVVTSAELVEESIVPMLPYLRDKLAQAMADAQEDGVINGQVTAIDSDVTATTDPRKAWDGYRVLAPAGTKVANSNTDPTVLDVKDLRSVRQAMGKYAVNPEDVVFITGPVGYMKLLSLKDGSNPSPVLTVDKYGDRATIVTGEIGRVDGVPVIVSPHVREDLNDSGVFDGVTTDRTELFLVHRRSFVFGDYRAMSLRSRDIIETDQTVLVVLQRLTFAPWISGEPAVGFVYNIQK